MAEYLGETRDMLVYTADLIDPQDAIQSVSIDPLSSVHRLWATPQPSPHGIIGERSPSFRSKISEHLSRFRDRTPSNSFREVDQPKTPSLSEGIGFAGLTDSKAAIRSPGFAGDGIWGGGLSGLGIEPALENGRNGLHKHEQQPQQPQLHQIQLHPLAMDRPIQSIYQTKLVTI